MARNKPAPQDAPQEDTPATVGRNPPRQPGEPAHAAPPDAASRDVATTTTPTPASEE